MLSVSILALLSTASAQNAELDHLKCYKVQDPLRLKGPKASWLDLDGPQFGLENCKIVGGFRLFCVPVTKSVTAALQGKLIPGGSLTDLSPFAFAGYAEEDRICYKIRCDDKLPSPPNPSQEVTDQFGTRTVEKLKPFLVCGPAFKGAPLTFKGLPHYPLGNASLSVVGTPPDDELVLSNIGPTGQDGVAIDVGALGAQGVGWSVDSGFFQTEAQVEVTLEANASFVAGFRVRFTDSQTAQLIVDATLPITEIGVDVRLGGTSQAGREYPLLEARVMECDLSGSSPGPASVEAEVLPCEEIGCGEDAGEARLLWPGPVQIQIPDVPPVQGDEIRVTFRNLPSITGPPSKAAFRVANSNSVTLTNVRPFICGNGVVEPGEQCDDGNTDDGDGCSASCQTE
jgi:cysteine-rich repeat protein